MNNPAIKLTNIGKKYVLHHEKPTLIENVFRFRRKEEIWALKDINLKIKRGEKIGIIGNNGSGKTTLLKIIAGITTPTTGKVKINGRIAALIDFEAGFHPELTGEENIYLNGMLLGMSRSEIRRQLDKIIEFSGLEKFIDAPFYTYSNGMRLRLGFSVAVHSNPDILLIDEILAVGDQEFQKKSYQKMQEFFMKEGIILFVSHRLETITKFCNKVILLQHGKINTIEESKNIIKSFYFKNRSFHSF